MVKKKNSNIDFRDVIKQKRIPILTLDEKWHQLFNDYDKPVHIKNLENKLNDLMKNQGQRVNDIKDLKALKKKLLEEIVNNMDASSDAVESLKVKKQIKSQKLVQEINEKLKQADEELVNIPYQIKAVNEQLLVESMQVCYERLKYNQDEIVKYAEWILKAREELKRNVLIKQDMEMKNTAIYTYMHNVLGADVIELLDNQQGLGK